VIDDAAHLRECLGAGTVEGDDDLDILGGVLDALDARLGLLGPSHRGEQDADHQEPHRRGMFMPG
jgi:hypothetical protein